MSSTIFYFLFIPLLAFILLAVNLIFAPHNPYMEKNSAFECGFSSFLGQNRTQFSISFFIFALLFLLFDLEILLVYPYLVSAYTNGVYGLVIMLMFLLALTLGFAFELGKKALSIDSRQMSNVSKSTKKKSNYISKINTNVSPFLNRGRRHYTSSSNNVNFEADITNFILYPLLRKAMIILSCCLFLTLFLCFILYVFALISFTPYLINTLLFISCLIYYTSDFYNIINKASVSSKTSIESYSNTQYITDFIITMGKFISELIRLAISIIGIFREPMIFIHMYIRGVFERHIANIIDSSFHYRVLKSIYCEHEFPISLKLSALFIHDSFLKFLKNKHNILNILCFYLACLYGKYNINFVIFSLFLESSIAILLVLFIITIFAIIYIDKPKGLKL